MADIPVCLRSVRMDLMRGSQPQQPVFLSATNFGTSCWVSPPASRIAFRSKLAFTTSSPPAAGVTPVPAPCLPSLPPAPAPIPHPCPASLSPAPTVTPPLPSPLSPVVTPIPTKTTQKWHLSEGHRRAKLEATPRPGHHAGSIACRCIGTCGLANPAAQAPGTRHPAAAPAFIPSQSGSRRLAVQVPGARQQTPSSRQITTYPPNRIHQEKT